MQLMFLIHGLTKLTGKLASTMLEVDSLTPKQYVLKEVHDKTTLEHEELLRKVQAEAKTSKERNGAEHDRSFPRYYGLLRSIRKTVKAADECNASQVHTSTQTRLLLEEGHEVKKVSSTTGTSQKGHWDTTLKSRFETKNFPLQTFVSLASENLILRAEVSYLRGFVETLDCENKIMGVRH